PLPRCGLLVAKILSVIVIQCLQVGLLMLVAGALFGWRPGGALASPVAVLLLGTVAFAALGLLMAGALRAEATLAAANGLYLIFLLLGDMVFPLGQLPEWLASAARLLPAAAFAQALRASLQPGGVPPLSSLFVLGLWAALALLSAVRTF